MALPNRASGVDDRQSITRDSGPAPIDGNGGGGHPPGMDDLTRRVDRMEGLLDEMKPLLARLDERLNHLATKADLSATKGELLEKLAEKPGKGYLWTVLAVLVGAILASVAAGVSLK